MSGATSGATAGTWEVRAIARGRVIGDETAQGAEKLQIGTHNKTIATVYRPQDCRVIVEAPAMRDALKLAAPILDSVLNGSPEFLDPDEVDAALSGIRAILDRIEAAERALAERMPAA